jgi:uncharacterized protein YaaN involved in tellurite resistance
MWQNAALAEQSAEMGQAFIDVTNQLVQKSFGAAADATEKVAAAAEAPLLTAETGLAIVQSVKRQCEAIIAADRWGRQQRAQLLPQMQTGEADLAGAESAMRRQLVAGSLAAASHQVAPAPVPDSDILAAVGVK